jgi:divalent metal cation (Fe/Co/Zn/Cd) transporter
VNPQQVALVRRGLLLEYLTLGWNVVGATVVVLAAIKAHSVALAGFGLDSLIEIGASTIVVWELTETGRDREKRALRLIGAAFFALAVYILVQSIRTLSLRLHPGTSPVGIVWLALTLAAMLALAAGKHHTGKQLNNPVLLTEGRVTLVDAFLAGSVLVSLVLNALLGWWWADPAASLVLVSYGLTEGRRAWAEGA